jgi:prepilin-type N-terminal cleavage/methylation domain-containing protein
MKHFKHLKTGMTLIEVMMAIAILAIFGTSLFIMQQFLFERMNTVQYNLSANLRMQSELVAYQANILKELFEQQGIVDKSLYQQKKDFTHPDMTIIIDTNMKFTVINGQEKSSSKNFNNLYLTKAQAGNEDDPKKYGKSYVFLYIPEASKS